ncbi:hypothetical protein ACJMK2_043484, partial [Sinanodonta woodiana]
MNGIESTNNYLLESSTANGTTTFLDEELEEMKQIQNFLKSSLITFQIVFGLIIVTGLVGNILTVAIILRYKGDKSITDFLILTLNVTDIFVILFSVPMHMLGYDIITMLVGDVWCRLIDYVTYSCNYASMYVLVLISLDRYLALAHPITSMPFRTKRNCYILILIIWSIIILGNMPMLFENQFCLSVETTWNDSSVRRFYIRIFVFEFMLPLLLMCILYGQILKTFHKAKIPGVNNTTSRVRLISYRHVIKM